MVNFSTTILLLTSTILPTTTCFSTFSSAVTTTKKTSKDVGTTTRAKIWMLYHTTHDNTIGSNSNYYRGPQNQTDSSLSSSSRINGEMETETTIAAMETEQQKQWITDFFEESGESVTTQEEETKKKKKQKFDWFDHWYPVNVVETMDITRPHKVQLLGLNLVIWNDGPSPSKLGIMKEKTKGNWNAFLDSCPHRRAPLSEGTIEDDGTLLCSYHGWRFQGEKEGGVTGQCSSLPYSPDRFEDQHRKKACSAVFPTKTVDGMVWVFPQSGLEGIIRSEQRPLPLVSELHSSSTDEDDDGWRSRRENKDWLSRIPAGVRDFPCNFDTMIENTLDPAHFCAAHHGTLGNKYTDPSAFDFRVTQSLTMKDGFALDGDMGALEFVPPCLVKYSPDYPAMPYEKNLLIATYCVPTKPGWVRPLATVLLRKEKKEKRKIDTLSKRALDVFMGPYTPTWFGHIASSIVLHQDAALLYHQYHNMRSMGYYNNVNTNRGIASTTKATESSTTTTTKREKKLTYQDLCYTPNRVDKGIVTFRRWFDTMAEGDVSWACGTTNDDNLRINNNNNPMQQQHNVIKNNNNNMLSMQQRLQQHQNHNHHHISDEQQQGVDIYDMYHAHTKNCEYCSTAYRNSEITKKSAFAIAFLTIALPSVEYHLTDIQRTAVILTCLGIGFALEKFNELFLRYEVHHHD